MVNALVPGTSAGISLHHWSGRWTGKLGLFSSANIESGDLFSGTDGYGITGRLTYTPVRTTTRVVHFGFNSSYQLSNDSNRLRFRTRPESNVNDKRLISTGRMVRVNSHYVGGVEAALFVNPFYLQGEYIRTHVFRFGGRQNETFDGGYLSFAWLINGRRPYSKKTGTFREVKRTSSIAWELAFRYSHLNLNSSTGTVTGGAQTNLSVALNTYLSERVRIMLNYVNVNTDSEAGDDDPGIFQMRIQVLI